MGLHAAAAVRKRNSLAVFHGEACFIDKLLVPAKCSLAITTFRIQMRAEAAVRPVASGRERIQPDFVDTLVSCTDECARAGVLPGNRYRLAATSR